jgi:hypothetical protein
LEKRNLALPRVWPCLIRRLPIHMREMQSSAVVHRRLYPPCMLKVSKMNKHFTLLQMYGPVDRLM